jgi:hypothetical protein
MAQAEAGVSAVAGSDPAAQGSGPSEVAAPSTGGVEPGSSSTAEAAVEAAMAEASVRDVERANADVVMEDVPPVAGQEAAQPGEPQPQQDPPAEPVATVEGGVVEPSPMVPEEEAPAIEGPAPVEGSTPVMVDLTLDDSPLDKGKQVVGVEGVEGLRRRMDRSFRVVMEAVSRGMRDTIEVCFGLSVLLLSFCCPPFSWFSTSLVFPNRDQEHKALARQWALVEEANKQLSDQSAEMAELRVAYAAVQAWAAEAVVREDVTKAREEAAKAREDLVPLSARVKELEEDVTLVSRPCDTLNV